MFSLDNAGGKLHTWVKHFALSDNLFLLRKNWRDEKWHKQLKEHRLLQSVAGEISIFLLLCLHRQLQIRSRKYTPRGVFVLYKRTLAWEEENVLVQSVLAPFVARTAGCKLQVSHKSNRNGKEEKWGRKGKTGANKELCE